jgi:hypothetical protein
MMRYFVAGNFWLFVAFVCFVEHTRGLFSPDTVPAPLVLSAIFFVLYWLTSPAIAFQFSIRTLLVIMTVMAVLMGIFVVLRV